MRGNHGRLCESIGKLPPVPSQFQLVADQPGFVRPDVAPTGQGNHRHQRRFAPPLLPIPARDRDEVLALNQQGAQIEHRRFPPVRGLAERLAIDPDLRLVVAAYEQLRLRGNILQFKRLTEPGELTGAFAICPDPGQTLADVSSWNGKSDTDALSGT